MAVTTKKDVRRGIKIYIDGSEVVANSSSIRAEMKKIRESMKHMTLGSDEYREATKKWASLNTILKEHEQGLRQIDKTQQSLGSRIKGFFNMCTAKLTALAGVLYSVMNIFGKFYDQFSQKQDTAANLKALTGLDDNSIEWLTQQAEQLSTTMDETGLRIRSSSKEILDAYMMVGSAKPELLKDKEALNAVTIEALRLSEAAKMDVKDAVGAVTTSLNQFGAGADQAARYVNVLAAGSKEGAANVTEQAAAVVKAGVAANGANVSFEQLVGCIEMLGEKGIKAEVAGTGLKKFFLTLQTGAKETNPAVVGLDQALQTLADKQMSAEHIKKMFGEEGFNVAKILMDNTEKVRQYTDAVTDTNVATEQAAINSDTTAARLAQLGNQWNELGMQLIGAFIPALEASVSVTSRLIDGGRVLLSFIKEHYVEIGILAVAYNALTIKTVVTTTAQKAWTLAVTVGHGIVRAYHATLLLLQAGWLLVTQGTQAATVAMRAFNIASKGTGLGVLVAVVATAAVGIYELTRRTKEATAASQILEKVNKNASDQFATEAGIVDMLNKTVHDNTARIEDRKAALDRLRKIVPDYLGELDEEGRLVRDNKQAIDDYLVSLEKQIKLKAAQEELEEQYRQKRQQERRIQTIQSNIDDAQQRMLDAANGNSHMAGSAAVINYANQINAGTEVLKKAEAQLQRTMDGIGVLEQEIKTSDLSSIVSPTTTTEPTPPITPSGGPGGGKDDAAKQELEAIEAKYAQRLNELKERYRQGDIKSEQEYNQLVEDLEMERLEESLRVAGLEPKQRAELQAKVLDIYLQTKKKLDAVLKDNESAELSSYKKQLQELNKKQQEEQYTVERAHTMGLLDEETYQKALTDIQKKYQKLRAKALESSDSHKRWTEIVKKTIYSAEGFQKEHNGEIFSFLFDLRKEIDETSLKLLELDKDSEAFKQSQEYLDALIKLYNDKGKVITGLALNIGESLGQALADGVNGEWHDVQSAFKSMLVMVLDAIEKMIEASMLVPTLQMLTGIGAGKAWLSLAKIAAVKMVFAALKQSVQYYDTGGFTGDGRWDEPRGIVHAGEFVANRYAVANAAVRPVLDLLDQAQRAGTIRNLTAEDIAAVSGRATAGSAASSQSQPTHTVSPISTIDKETRQLLRECTATMRRVCERFDRPIVAETYATGRGGVTEAQKLVEKMNNNASRRRK